MKILSKCLGLILVASALLLTACAKKPVRSASDASQTGPNNSIDPTQVAIGADPSSLLTQRDAGTVDDANKSVVEPVYFALDRFAVTPAERPKVEAAVKWLAENANEHLVLVGHCDWRGTAEYNLGLGDRRANAVKRYLESLGVDPMRLETLSKGSTDAKQAGSEADWTKDRRVDFVVLKR
jgi:peptidoglycan-associated lipoprotein